MLLVNLIINSHYLKLYYQVFQLGTVSGAPKIRAMEIIDELRKK